MNSKRFFLLFNALFVHAIATQVPYPKSYEACTGCHGIYGEKNSFIKKSKPNTLTKLEIITALQGYQKGTYDKYGKSMLMRGFAKRLKPKDVEDIAHYLSTQSIQD